MPCPNYEGNRHCAFKSEYYLLSPQHIKEVCEAYPLIASDYYSNCDIFTQYEKGITEGQNNSSKGIVETI